MLQNFFQDTLTKSLLNYKEIVKTLNTLESRIEKLSQEEIQERTLNLKTFLTTEQLNESVIIESFALVREATKRVLKIRHFDVQLIGGLILYEGKIAEMKTGEGKTIVALLPTFLNALYGKGVHVITTNDYLARRDAQNVGRVHKFLGLTVGLIQENMKAEERKKNYNCDVVYLTNNELGFDYLRDNMAFTTDEIVQRPFFYCVVDEVDSILIDEARTPLIISGINEAPTKKYFQSTKLANALQKNIHYSVDEKNQNVVVPTILTVGRETLAKIGDHGNLNQLSRLGVQIIPDICWCSITEPVFPPKTQSLITNSGKYAHYGEGLTGRNIRFGSLNDCASAALTGFVNDELPKWLNSSA